MSAAVGITRRVADVRHILRDPCGAPGCHHLARFYCAACRVGRCGLHARGGRSLWPPRCKACDGDLSVIA
jgi:hypothetical protein